MNAFTSALSPHWLRLFYTSRTSTEREAAATFSICSFIKFAVAVDNDNTVDSQVMVGTMWYHSTSDLSESTLRWLLLLRLISFRWVIFVRRSDHRCVCCQSTAMAMVLKATVLMHQGNKSIAALTLSVKVTLIFRCIQGVSGRAYTTYTECSF